MNQCYFNTDHSLKIESGEEKKCSELVDGLVYCEAHKIKVWGEAEEKNDRSLESIQAKLKEMGRRSKSFKTKPLGLMTIQELLPYRLEIKEWLITHPKHEKEQEGLKKLRAVELELIGRGIVNPDGNNT